MFNTCTLGEQWDRGPCPGSFPLSGIPVGGPGSSAGGFWVSAGGSVSLLSQQESGLAASGSTTFPVLLQVCKRLLNTAMKTSWRQPALSAALTNPILFHYPSQKEPVWRNRAALSSSPASAHVRNVLGHVWASKL